MPRLLDTHARAADLTDSFLAALDGAGLAPPSTRAIARGAGISAGTLAHHIDNRERLVRLLTGAVAERFAHERVRRLRRDGTAAFLPAAGDPASLALTRAWLHVRHLAVQDEVVAAQAAHHDVLELDDLEQVASRDRWPMPALRRQRFSDLPPLDDGDESVLAALTGLRHRVCRCSGPLPVDRAAALLDQHLAAAGWAGSPPAARRLSP